MSKLNGAAMKELDTKIQVNGKDVSLIQGNIYDINKDRITSKSSAKFIGVTSNYQFHLDNLPVFEVDGTQYYFNQGEIESIESSSSGGKRRRKVTLKRKYKRAHSRRRRY